MNSRWTYLFAAVLLILSCEKSPFDPGLNYESEVSIFALLTLNNDSEHIIIEETFRTDSYIPQNRGIEDAKVFLETSEQKIQLNHTSKGRYMDTRQILRLYEGDACKLNVILTDGREFSAKTIIPDAPTITQPLHADNIDSYSVLDIKWKSSIFANHYIISISNIGGDFNTTAMTDTLETAIFPFLFAPPNVYIIKVAAASPEYYEYIQSAPKQKSQGNINGAVGVFGALAYHYITVEAE